MRKVVLIAAVAVVAVPATALAAEPNKPTQPSTPVGANGGAGTNPNSLTVLYVLRGTLSKYTSAHGTTNGSISIKVKSANFDSTTLKGRTLTFAVNSKTNVVRHAGKAIADGDNGLVKVQARKHSSPATLQAFLARQLLDQGAAIY
jgi:ribosomal protein L14